MLTDRRWPLGRKLQVRLPVARGLRRSVTLHGQVVRVEPAARDGGTDQQLSVALQFEPLVGREREEVREILRERVAGPAARTDAPDDAPTLGRLLDADAPARYEREVTAICRSGTHTLLGRDLCGEGLHVERSATLRAGEKVRLALHGAAREEPFLVEAHVERDDGTAGWFLKFDSVDSDAHCAPAAPDGRPAAHPPPRRREPDAHGGGRAAALEQEVARRGSRAGGRPRRARARSCRSRSAR